MNLNNASDLGNGQVRQSAMQDIRGPQTAKGLPLLAQVGGHEVYVLRKGAGNSPGQAAAMGPQKTV